MQWNPVSRIFMGLTERFPTLRQTIWSNFYNLLTYLDPKGQLLFMNYGYAELNETQSLKLKPEDETFRYSIQLYTNTVNGVELQNKDIVEVGSGRGGAGSFFLRYFQPNSFTGVDLSKNAVAWCNQHLQFQNARWLQGKADALPLPDACADVVVNVESCQNYPCVKDFLAEVKRILRPGGYLAISDFRTKTTLVATKNALNDFVKFAAHPKFGDITKFKSELENSGLKIIETRDITPNVIKALEIMSKKREEQINALVPFLLKGVARDFAAEKSSGVYEQFVTGQIVYVNYILQKI